MRVSLKVLANDLGLVPKKIEQSNLLSSSAGTPYVPLIMSDGTVKYRKRMPKNVKFGCKKSLPSLEHKKSKQ